MFYSRRLLFKTVFCFLFFSFLFFKAFLLFKTSIWVLCGFVFCCSFLVLKKRKEKKRKEKKRKEKKRKEKKRRHQVLFCCSEKENAKIKHQNEKSQKAFLVILFKRNCSKQKWIQKKERVNPAAGSPTATLLRLHFSYNPHRGT